MAGFITKGAKLGYKSGSASSFTDLTNLVSIPDLGGDKDSIEITTLTDGGHIHMNGLENYGDKLAFKFLYDPTQFATLAALTGVINWQVSLPDGTNGAVDTLITFSGECDVVLNGFGVNEAMYYTLNITPNSAMTIA